MSWLFYWLCVKSETTSWWDTKGETEDPIIALSAASLIFQQWVFPIPAGHMTKQTFSLLCFLVCTLSPHIHWSEASIWNYFNAQINFSSNVLGLLSLYTEHCTWWSLQSFLNRNISDTNSVTFNDLIFKQKHIFWPSSDPLLF